MDDVSTSVFSAPTIHGATLPGNREKPNEDAWGFTLDCAWVLDGATLAEYPPNERTLVSDFVSCVNDEIRAAVGSDFDAPLRDLVAEAMASPAVKRFAAHEVEVSATLAMARVRASGVEWLLLGDAGILVPSASGIDFHTDDRLARVASRQRATLRRYRREPSHDGAILRAAAAELTREESRHRNREGGFWVLSNHSSSASHAREGTAPNGGTVVLGTDGLFNAFLKKPQVLQPSALYRELAQSEDLNKQLHSIQNKLAHSHHGKTDDITAVAIKAS